MKQRLRSLDVFRGITIAGMILVNNPGSWSHIYPPLQHATWNGVTPTDWIFPFFLFIVGVAIALALGKRKEEGVSFTVLYQKIAYRSVVIFVFGFLLGLFPDFNFEGPQWLAFIHYLLLGVTLLAMFFRETVEPENQWYRTLSWVALVCGLGLVVIGITGHYNLSHKRIPGVLQRIALVYALCSILFLHFSIRTQVWIGVGILFAYWGVQTLLPVPGGSVSVLEPGLDFGSWLDRLVFTENHMWRQSKTWDPEGLFSTLPAVVTGLSGVVCGHWLRQQRSEQEKLNGIFAVGVLLLGLGLIWAVYFPLNKSLWSSSYVLYTSGVALLFFGLVFWLVDLKGSTWWIKPFEVYGANALFAYLLSGMITLFNYKIHWTTASGETMSLHTWIYQTFFTFWLGDKNASLGFAVWNVLVVLGFCWVLYRKKILIKV